MKKIALFLFLLFLVPRAGGAAEEDRFAEKRKRMVESQIEWRGVTDPKVLEVMRRVPRHLFVDESQRAYAYADHPLPIGYGQTISQPYIVAVMTELLRVGPGDTVFELGTGSGYQAAILAELTKEVYTVEIVKALGDQARERLKDLGYKNVTVKVGDGYFGWKEHAPFDAIVVTAAATHIPPPLIEQLKPGGRMIIPVGPPFQIQTLLLVEKRRDGSITQRSLMSVAFVPLRGEHSE